jgi:hypothetical protein
VYAGHFRQDAASPRVVQGRHCPDVKRKSPQRPQSAAVARLTQALQLPLAKAKSAQDVQSAAPSVLQETQTEAEALHSNQSALQLVQSLFVRVLAQGRHVPLTKVLRRQKLHWSALAEAHSKQAEFPKAYPAHLPQTSAEGAYSHLTQLLELALK